MKKPAKKRVMQIILTDEDELLVNQARQAIRARTDRELVLTLCREAINPYS